MDRAAADDFARLPMPAGRRERVTLLAMRRMAVLGLRDASASWLMVAGLGAGFLEPLNALRAFLHGLTRCARRKPRIAGCCARYMTTDEAVILAVLGAAAADRWAAERMLIELAQGGDVERPLGAAVRFGTAVAGTQVRA